VAIYFDDWKIMCCLLTFLLSILKTKTIEMQKLTEYLYKVGLQETVHFFQNTLFFLSFTPAIFKVLKNLVKPLAKRIKSLDISRSCMYSCTLV